MPKSIEETIGSQNAQVKEMLSEIKKAIYANATDVLFMAGNTNDTVVEFIDGHLAELGMTDEEIEAQTQEFQNGAS